MSKKILTAVALILMLAMALTSCGPIDYIKGLLNPAVELTDAPLNAEKLIDFANGADASVLFESDGWTNGDVFNVVWKKHNVHYENGIMRLGITEEKASAWLNDSEVEFDYTAGEARTQNYYHYGDYEVSMKPSANGGTASTFFVCTGPYDTKFVLDANGDYVLDENGQRTTVENPHDEIDIEFLGKDTTKVQFNFFVDGKGGNEYMYDLGFDASLEFHTYGFRWAEDSITWFVDGEPVYKVTTDANTETAKNLKYVEKLPSTPGRMLTNYWCGTAGAWGWMGTYSGDVNDQGTEYQWIATGAEGKPLNPPEEPPVNNDDIDWTAINSIAPNFASAEKYTVTLTENNTARITYTDVGGSEYKPVELDITEAATDKNFVYLKVTNNGTETVNVRVNVIDQALVDKGAQNVATNVYATMDGVSVNTDLVWGGSFFNLEANQTAELVVKFDGAVEKLQLMLDSSRNNASLYSGDVTVEQIKFAKLGEIILPPEDACEHMDADGNAKCDKCGEDMIVPPSPPENPESGYLTAVINGTEVTFAGNVADAYGVDADDENNTVNVTYTNVVGNSYRNFWANVSAIAGTKNVFTMKVTNNGDSAVKVRIDMESETQINANTTACNLSATQDGNSVYTDLEWGGSTFVIEAGATSTLSVVYDAAKTPTNLKIFVDSCQWDDSETHAGSITISEMAFSGEYTPEGDEPVNPPADDPVVPPTEEPEDTGLQLNFYPEDNTGYTVDGLTIEYNGAGNTYKPVTAPGVAELAAGNNTFTVTITNNGATDAHVRIDMQGSNWVATGDGSGTDACNVSAVGGNVWTDTTWGGSALTVPTGESITLVITYNGNGAQGAVQNVLVFVDSARGDASTYNSDITLSGIAFSNVGGDPVDPPAEEPVEGEYVEFHANECYTLHNTEQYVNNVRVTYTNVSKNTYQNVNTWIADKASGKTALSVTIKNNGTETALVTVKLEDAAGALGESTVEIAAGETVTVTISYTGDAVMLYFFIDSGWSSDTTQHSGDVTISGIKFA